MVEVSEMIDELVKIRGEILTKLADLKNMIKGLEGRLNSINDRLEAVEKLVWEEAEYMEHVKDETWRLDRKIQNEERIRTESTAEVMERLDVAERDISDIRSEIRNIYQRLEVIEEQKMEELHNRLIVVEEGIESVKAVQKAMERGGGQ